MTISAPTKTAMSGTTKENLCASSTARLIFPEPTDFPTMIMQALQRPTKKANERSENVLTIVTAA